MKRIAHITDLHLDEQFPIENGVRARENWKLILKDVMARQIDELVFTGDIGTTDSNQWFFASIKKHQLTFNVTLGNHDTFAEANKFYNPGLPKGQNELYYTNEDKFFKYLFLDTSTSKVSKLQFEWLKRSIDTNKKIIVFIHHPILETNTTPQKEYPLEGAEMVKAELLKLKREVYLFCGHLHFDDKQTEGNITQFVTPAACFQAKKHSATTEKDNISFGYRILELDEDKISNSVIMI
jgi:3',5'-cyclic-AMP phosphodiesterase